MDRDICIEIHVNVWLTIADAARKLSISEDSISRRAIPYTPGSSPVAGKVRYKDLYLDTGKKEGRRFLESDLELMLKTPSAIEQPNRRKLFVKKY
jgi:hypothetical protein